MGSATFTLMIITIISKISGLVREILFAKFFGTGNLKDIYVIANSITAMSFSFLFLSIQSTFIPLYTAQNRKYGRKVADHFTANLTNTFLLIAFLIIGLFFVFMPQVVHLVASGFTGEKFEQAVLFTRIAMFQILFSALSGSMIGYLNYYHNFVTPATTGIIMNVVMVFFSIATALTGNMILLAVGTVISTGLQYLYFPRALRSVGYHHRWILNPLHPSVIESLGVAVPAMFSVLVNDLSVIVDKTIATRVVPNGGASALDYANLIFMMVQGIVIVSIVTASFPDMSKLAASRDLRPFKRVVRRSLVTGLLIVIPAALGMMLYASPIIRFFFERDQFDARSTLMTAGALFWYTPGLIALLFSQILIRAFYALHDTRIPLLVSAVQVGLDVTLNFILSHFFGLNGLAASTMIGNTFGAFLLAYWLRKRIGSLGFHALTKSSLKITVISVVMGALSYLLFTHLGSLRESIRLFLAVLLAVLIYGVLILFAQIPEVKQLVNQLYHNKWKKRNALKK